MIKKKCENCIYKSEDKECSRLVKAGYKNASMR